MGKRMDGFRASSLRQVCKHCKTRFKPSRASAEFCRNLCRQAYYRGGKKADAELTAAAVFQKRKAEAVEVINDFDRFQSVVAAIQTSMDGAGFRDVKFMATQIGV